MANAQEPKAFFRPWVEDQATETVEDVVNDDLSLLSEKNKTYRNENLNTEYEKPINLSNWSSKPNFSGKKQQMKIKTVSSLSENPETESCVYKYIGREQSRNPAGQTSSRNFCKKNVECQILETCSSNSKPIMPTAISTEFVTCISSTYKTNTESIVKRGEKFANRDCLIKHVRTRTDEKPQCLVCSKIFKRKKYLNIHMRTHTGQRTHQCVVCNNTFVKKSYLITHMSTHTGIKPHQCEVCDRKFAHKGNLTMHMLTHTGQKPHRCTVCDKSFSQKSNLKKHMRTHTNEKPYICPECKQTFTTRCNLNNHIKKHTN